MNWAAQATSAAAHWIGPRYAGSVRQYYHQGRYWTLEEWLVHAVARLADKERVALEAD